MTGGFGGGFSQGLSAVLSQGLPLVINQRLHEQKLAQEEEELKLKKKESDARGQLLAAQTQKLLRETLMQQALGQMVPGLPGASEAAPMTEDLAEPAAGIDPGRRLTGKGQLAQMLVMGGKMDEALKLFPEMTRPSPAAIRGQLRETLDALSGGAAGMETAAPQANAAPAMAAAPGGAVPGMPAARGAPSGPAMTLRPTINVGSDGKMSISLSSESTKFQVAQVDVTDEQGFVQKYERVFDPVSGRVVNVYPISPRVPPEFMQKAMAQVRAVMPDAPKEVQEGAAGMFLGLEGPARAEHMKALKAVNAKFRALKGGTTADMTLPDPGDAVEAAKAGEVQQAATKAAAETRARIQTQREEEPVAPGQQQKLQMYKAAERQVDQIGQLYRPEFVGKGLQGFRKGFDAADAKVAHGKGDYEQIVPGGLAGGLREWLGTASREEVTFRKAVLDVGDMLLRARSGAQVTEQEYQRLKNMLFSVLDEPATFEAGVARFKAEINAQIGDLLELQTKSARQMQQERTGGAAKPKAPAKAAAPAAQTYPQTMIIRGPNGQQGKLAPGYAVPKGWTLVGPYPGGK